MRIKLFLPLLLLSLILAACAPVTPVPVIPTAHLDPATNTPSVEALATATPALEPAATATNQLVTVTDARGQEYRFEQPAERIISLAPSNTEILFAIGAGSQLVGRDSFSDYPADAANITDIGGGFGALNTEAILSANPDLVLAADITPAEQIKALEDLGLRVFVLGNPVEMPELYGNLRTVAQITGHVEETETLVASLEARVKAVEDKIATITERPLVLYELDGTDPNAPWVPGPGTFISNLIKTAGGENIGDSLDGAWVQISLEALIEKDPTLIVLGDATWGGVTPEIVAARGGWDALTAVKESKIFPFDDNLVSRPGPRLVDGLEALAKLLHPDLFK